MILNTMVWLRREVVALPDKQATSAAGTDEQIDAAGSSLGIGQFYLDILSIKLLYIIKMFINYHCCCYCFDFSLNRQFFQSYSKTDTLN